MIEEMYQKRLAEENPKTDLEKSILRKEVEAQVLNLPKEGGIETLYQKELEVSLLTLILLILIEI